MTFTQLLFSLAIALVAAAGSYGAARYAGKSSVKVKEIDVDAAAYERAEKINAVAFQRLEREVVEQGKKLAQVEEKADKTTKDLEIAVNWMEAFLTWEQDGSRPPRPTIPTALRKHINRALFIEQRQEQLQHNQED